MSARPKKILFICGSLNQTTQMHQIANELPEYRKVFSPYYGNRDFDFLKSIGALEYTIGGHKLGKRCLNYLRDNDLPCEPGGALGDFDLALHCSDLVWPKNLDGKPSLLVQEGMTDPESVLFPVYKRLSKVLPGWVAGTSAFGLTNAYTKFCVASEGYKELFTQRGCDPSKIIVTGIPNFDDCQSYANNDFPHHGYVLCCTSDVREVFWYEDRKTFLLDAVKIAKDRGKKLIIKLHPNEKLPRATDEIARWAPEAIVYTSGNAEQMVANCDTLICKFSSLAYVGIALGKEVFSYFKLDDLKKLMPLQNKIGAKNIANVARQLLGDAPRDYAAREPHAAAAQPQLPAQLPAQPQAREAAAPISYRSLGPS
ncbi:MAG: hypothetical protein IPM79_17440 [Polyangiaceae bacterium]|nr:hypothetical protein [Polyangiaceae bacterium]